MDHHGRGRPLKSGGDRNRRGRGKGKRRWFDSEQEEFEEKHTAHERSLERRDRRWMGNVRFVQLQDCGHIIDKNVLDKWLMSTTNENYSVIQVRVCPSCKKPIRSCCRYMHLVKQARSDVEEVKKQIIGNEEKNRKKLEEVSQMLTNVAAAVVGIVTSSTNFYRGRMGLQSTQKEFSNSAGLFLYNVRRHLDCVSVSISQIASLEYKVDMFKQLCNLKQKANNISDLKGHDLKKYIEKAFLEMLQWVNSLSYVSSQNEDDWNCEVRRISTLLKLMEALSSVSVTKNPPAGNVIKKIYDIVTEGSRYSIYKQINVGSLFRELARHYSPLKPFEEETKIVVHMIGWASGVWLKCQNGHVYSTGDTTSSWERRKCPKCERAISGGEHHQLEAVNRLTSAMASWKISGNNHE